MKGFGSSFQAAAQLRMSRSALAAQLHDPGGSHLIDVLRDRVTLPRQIVLDILLAGVARGEIRAEAEAAVPNLSRTGPALLFQHIFMYGTTAPLAVIEEIVDRVILPAARPLPATRTSGN